MIAFSSLGLEVKGVLHASTSTTFQSNPHHFVFAVSFQETLDLLCR
jgi:hypothetical protein